MGWRISYTIDQHYKDEDNYGQTKTGNVQYSFGDTIDDAVKHILSDLKETNNLDHLIESMIESEGNVYGYEGISVDICSVDVVSESSWVDFESHPLVLELINKKKNQIKLKEEAKKQETEEYKRQKELAQYKLLKGKYENRSN